MGNLAGSMTHGPRVVSSALSCNRPRDHANLPNFLDLVARPHRASTGAMPYARRARVPTIRGDARKICGMRIQHWSLAVAAGLTAVIAGIFMIGGDPLPLLWYAKRRTSACSLTRPQTAVARHRSLLRRVPQRDRSRRRLLVREARPRRLPTQRRGLGSRRAQSCAPGSCRRSASRGPSARCSTEWPRWFEHELDAAWARAPNPGAKPARAPEPHRVRERDSRPAWRTTRGRSRARCRPTRPSAASTTTRLRSACRRRCSKATRSRDADRPPRGRRPLDGPRRGALHGVSGGRRSSGTSKVCRSALAAASPSSTRSRSTPSTSSSCRQRFRPPAGKTRPGKMV